jgi:hypothetical protein
MKPALSLLVLWLCCIATVSAKMPLWGLPVPGSRAAGGNVKTGSASVEESLDMGDLTNRNRTAGDDGMTVAENGLTNELCCVADAKVAASMNRRDGMWDAFKNIHNGMV